VMQDRRVLVGVRINIVCTRARTFASAAPANVDVDRYLPTEDPIDIDQLHFKEALQLTVVHGYAPLRAISHPQNGQAQGSAINRCHVPQWAITCPRCVWASSC